MYSNLVPTEAGLQEPENLLIPNKFQEAGPTNMVGTNRGEMSSEELEAMHRRKDHDIALGIVPPFNPVNSNFSSKWELPETA